MKQVDLEEPPPFLDQLHLGCTQRECKPNKNLVDEYKPMFESLTPAGATEELPCSGEVNAQIAAWSFDTEGHARKKPSSSCIESPRLVSMITSSRKRSWKRYESGGELSKVCSQIVLTCLYLARIGSPVTLWSVSKPTRAVTNGREPVTNAFLV